MIQPPTPARKGASRSERHAGANLVAGAEPKDGNPVPAGPRHRGDIMSPAKRSALMARIRGRGTKPEKLLGSGLHKHGLRWRSHDKKLAGRPDFVFRRWGVVVFVDGDFWHGWRFSQWRDRLTLWWETKINSNRKRDARNHRRLRLAGWIVVRVWEHQIENDLEKAVGRVICALTRAGWRKLTCTRISDQRGPCPGERRLPVSKGNRSSSAGTGVNSRSGRVDAFRKHR